VHRVRRGWPRGNYRPITLSLTGTVREQLAIDGNNVIEREHGSAPEQQKILPGATEEIANNIMNQTDLTGAVTVNNFGKPAGRQVLPNDSLNRI
jgi:hypothetical protein